MSRAHDIAVLPGDGIGPEVTDAAFRVLEALADGYGFRLSRSRYPYSGRHYQETGELLPQGALAELADHDAIFLGAIGQPGLPEGIDVRGIVLRLRFELNLYINLRPVRLYAAHLTPLAGRGPEDIDFVVIRENSEGAYSGSGGIVHKDTDREVATAEMVYTAAGVERVLRYAFELAAERDGHLTMVDKANVIPAHDLWRRKLAGLSGEYPEVATETAFADAAAMWMVKDPDGFDVVVTTNLFGDILTDLGAMLQGGMGIAASGNIDPQGAAMFEPIHGSAPRYAGSDRASPLGAVMAGHMMLEHLGEDEAAQALEAAVIDLLQSRRIPSLSTSEGPGTRETTDLIIDALRP